MRLGSSPGPARALILAAGRGERMRPLTDHTPKPLLAVRGRPLLAWWVDALARGGVRELVVNTAWLGQQIEDYFGLGPAPDLRIQLSNQEHIWLSVSAEGRDFGYALETAGGIARALPLLAPRPDDVFWVVAGDVFAPDFAVTPEAVRRFAASGRLAHLWLVPNPPHKPGGDFAIGADGLALNLGPTAAATGRPEQGAAPSGGSAAGAAAQRGGTVPATGRPEQGAAPSGGSAAGAAAQRGGTAPATGRPEPGAAPFTFSTIALYRRALFEPPWCDILPGNPQGTAAPLAPLLRRAIAAGQVSAELYQGAWTDVGTPERLAQLNGGWSGG